jgi:hypothetical protein
VETYTVSHLLPRTSPPGCGSFSARKKGGRALGPASPGSFWDLFKRQTGRFVEPTRRAERPGRLWSAQFSPCSRGALGLIPAASFFFPRGKTFPADIPSTWSNDFTTTRCSPPALSCGTPAQRSGELGRAGQSPPW